MRTQIRTRTASGLGSLPRVNLLPPEIAEARRFKRVQASLGGAVLACVGVVAALMVLAMSQVTSAQAELDAADAKAVTLEAQTGQYADVPLVYAQVEIAEAQIAQAMGTEVRWSRFMNDISLKTPGNVWLSSMTVAQAADAAALTAPVAGVVSPFAATGVGSVTFEGMGSSHNDVAAWLDALAEQKKLTQPVFTSSTKEKIGSKPAVRFQSQAILTDDSFSGRFTTGTGR